jgi:protein-S-isoprenylcysteine O-methyltransferase Ste14
MISSKFEMNREPSASNAFSVTLGLIAFLVGVSVIQWGRPFGQDLIPSALLIIGISSVPIFFVDICILKVHLRPTTGLNFSYSNPSIKRTGIKFIGLLASMSVLAIAYWLFPVYHLPFYKPFFEMVKAIFPYAMLISLPYIYLVDRHLLQPHDGYWFMGLLCILKFDDIDQKVLAQHLLGWLIKGFFMPLMFVFMCNDILAFWKYDITKFSFIKIDYETIFQFLYYIDVGIVSMGYLLTLRITDTHIRSAEPSMIGWLAALSCYQPFWSLLGAQYFDTDTKFKWGDWLADSPILYNIWGITILLLIIFYVWATVIFGPRFSNLTNRGIITNGPYRFTKHPAYISKNLSWWLVNIPFLGQGSFDDNLRNCLMLLALNGIYTLRAKTEERHLSMDPGYVRYALYMENFGIFRFIQKIPFLRALRYKAN